MRDLPPWTEWPDAKKMTILHTYMHWHLFSDGGKPLVIRRRRIVDKLATPPRELCDEEICELEGESGSMSEMARQSLRQAWAEHQSWNQANRRGDA